MANNSDEGQGSQRAVVPMMMMMMGLVRTSDDHITNQFQIFCAYLQEIHAERTVMNA
jgi:hypothetical protein